MEAKIDYKRLPDGFAICLKTDCEQGDNCLRMLSAQSVPAEEKVLYIINPQQLVDVTDDCPHFSSSDKVLYAKGFINILMNLPHKQMQVVIRKLIAHFGQRTYYRVRKGERLLSPDDQRDILNILADCGVSEPEDFDAYVEDYDWRL
jgi:hypothetical protein